MYLVKNHMFNMYYSLIYIQYIIIYISLSPFYNVFFNLKRKKDQSMLASPLANYLGNNNRLKRKLIPIRYL